MGFGSPDTRANSADAYYPGNSYVDVVADDIYDMGGRYEYDAMVDLYRAHPDKPFAIGEFGLWGLDHPGFVQDDRPRSWTATRGPRSRSTTTPRPGRTSTSSDKSRSARRTSAT